MKLHEHIAHHVRKHKEKVVAHVQKHHKKYIAGAGFLSGMAIYKIMGVIVMFFGMANMGGGGVGADYYDAEFYAQQASGNKINISDITENNIDNTNITGDNTPITTGEIK